MEIEDLIGLIKNSSGYKAYHYIANQNNISKIKAEYTESHFTYREERGKNFEFSGYINFDKNIINGIINYKEEKNNYYKVIKYEDNLDLSKKHTK